MTRQTSAVIPRKQYSKLSIEQRNAQADELDQFNVVDKIDMSDPRDLFEELKTRYVWLYENWIEMNFSEAVFFYEFTCILTTLVHLFCWAMILVNMLTNVTLVIIVIPNFCRLTFIPERRQIVHNIMDS